MAWAWWQRGVVYQVYPRSFADGNGDGTGDFKGIATRLPYLAKLGVDAVWLSPIYPSPMTDFGYDVADYCDIDPIFGTLAEFDALLDRAHALGLKVILDLVPNHSSDQHAWFQQSRRREGGKDDWYLWRDGQPGGGPPNNWLAHFGGSAWTFDPVRGQYYCHSFLPTQPDLNWRNPAVCAAMAEVMRFWLGRGVDGFRVDVIWLMIKDDQFRDNPVDPAWPATGRPFDRLTPLYTADRPEMQQVIAQMRRVVDEFQDRVLIGEIYLPIERLVTYYGADGAGVHLPFNFHLLLQRTWTAEALADLITQYEGALPPGAWPNWVLGNHDRSRVASRIGAAQARVAAILLLTLRGTPTIYMGEELGMVDTPIPPDSVRDPAELRQPGHGQGRDPVRTPFPWDGSPGRGFTSGTPWLPVGNDVTEWAQRDDPHAMLELYRRLLALRRVTPALSVGTIEAVRAEGPVLIYDRREGAARFQIALNLGDEDAAVMLTGGTVVVDALRVREYRIPDGLHRLSPNGGVVIRSAASSTHFRGTPR